MTRREQAVVIADIDPVYMNEGRPRQQALPAPVKLVAHLPIIEMLEKTHLVAAYTPTNGGFPMASPPSDSRLQGLGIHNAEDVAKAFGLVGAYVAKLGPTRLADSKSVLPNGEPTISSASFSTKGSTASSARRGANGF